MGNTDSTPKSSSTDWEKVITQNGQEIYKNKNNNELAEKRTISLDPHFDLDDQMKIYHMREYNNDSLVRTFRAQEVQNKGHSKGICSGHKKVEVFTERMPYRLTDLPQLTFSQSLLFLRQSLRAFYKVFRSYGPVHITKRMIGINDFGQVRCWVNQNWALNHPDHEFPILQSTKLQGLSQDKQFNRRSQVYDARYRDQTEMVHNIIAVIEEKCEEGRFPSAFAEEIQLHSGSFRKLSLYLQDFVGINHMFVPPKINFDTVFVAKYKATMTGNQTIGQVNQGQSYQSQNNILQNQSQNYQNQNYHNVQTLSYAAGGHSLSPIKHQYSSTLPILTNQSTTKYQTTGQSFNLPTYQLHTQQISSSIGNYTNTIITKQNESISNSVALNQSLKNQTQPTYNFASTGYTPSLSSSNNLWQKAESIYKPAQNQSSFSSSYYQYSMTNPSSIGNVGNPSGLMGTSHFGILTNTDLVSRTQNKPSSHTTLSNRLGSASNNSSSNNYIANNNYQNRTAQLNVDNGLSSNFKRFNTAQENNLHNVNNTLNVPQKTSRTYEQFKKEFSHTPLTTGTYTYQTYSETHPTYNNEIHKLEPSYSDSAEKSFTYSFDGKQDFASKFAEYAGKGYSNTRTNYHTQTSTNPSTFNTTGTAIQGRYADQFNSLLGPLVNTQSNYQTESKYDQNSTNQQNGSNVYEGLMKMVEHETNQPVNV